MTADIPAGLCIAAVPARAAAADALISMEGWTIDSAPPGARIGTSSSRRAAQIRHHRADLHVVALRGNLDTRLGKIGGEIDAAALAMAGIQRLFPGGLPRGLAQSRMDPAKFIPAPGQGCLALVTRRAESKCAEPLNDPESQTALMIEREVVARLNADCHTPLGAYAWRDGGLWRATAALHSPDGSAAVSVERSDLDASRLGQVLAERLLADGGEKILEAARRHEN